MTTTIESRRRARRLEVRTTAAERELIDRAVAASGTDITQFVLKELCAAARRVLADRTEFTLSPAAAEAWDEMNRRAAVDLPGLRALMKRPSPFAE